MRISQFARFSAPTAVNRGCNGGQKEGQMHAFVLEEFGTSDFPEGTLAAHYLWCLQ